ncbi:DEAD/DEAH box helicase [Mycobacterium hubeiense]|uniref:DEAD/DEAH box helicase n=1 Tax=Mycobacterium hubeiense TaxID=1867256 RepID=UPI000C7F5116|nr:DEAD/DEAH box helicase [Mycobacterium sp. QGD 101]
MSVPRPRPHQLAALDALTSVFDAGAERAQLRMACGSGKTLIGPWLAQRLRARTVVVFTPSIALVAQTIEAWQRSSLPMRTLAVCSDPTSAAGRAEIGVDGINPWARHEIPGRVTMRADIVARFLDDAAATPPEVTTVVVSTYHSAPVLAAALRLTDHCTAVDLVVADEAPHLAGRTAETFVPVLDSRAIPARRRLFQSATPIIVPTRGDRCLDELTGAADPARSMDDERVFGPVAYTLSVREAIAARLLADYRVVVTTHTAAAAMRAGDTAALAALAEVISRYRVRRILTFHNRVDAAHHFARRGDELGTVDGVRVRGFAVDGAMAVSKRRRILDALAGDDDVVTVVSSAQCLREGIDVPAVDAVVFADPRTSSVGIVQAIGRALRRHRHKSFGHIVIPAVLDPDGDDQEQLADSAYRHVSRVLYGLRAHDDRVAFELDRARGIVGEPDPAAVSWLDVIGDNPGAVTARLLSHTSSVWERYYRRLVETAERCGSAAAITSTVDKSLSEWITLQRKYYRTNSMDDQRARRLSQVPGWRWDAGEASDERSLAALDAVVAERGSLTENATGHSIYRGRSDGSGRPLGLWVATQLLPIPRR